MGGAEKSFFYYFSSCPFPQYLYSGFLSSAQVFRSWHLLHNACQLSRSQNRTLSPRWGLIWSTTVAFVYLPTAMHFTQSGWTARYCLLAFCQALPYPRLPALRISSGWSGLCFSQYFSPAFTSSGHPGWRHGTLMAFYPLSFDVNSRANLLQFFPLHGNLAIWRWELCQQSNLFLN